jgi:hypothetical protein
LAQKCAYRFDLIPRSNLTAAFVGYVKNIGDLIDVCGNFGDVNR